MRIHGLRYLYRDCSGQPIWGKVKKTKDVLGTRMVRIRGGSYVNVEAMTFFYPDGRVKHRGKYVCNCKECVK